MSQFEREWNASKADAGAYEDDVLGELLRCGARAIQAAAGLKVDGLAGPATIEIIEGILNKATEAPGKHDGRKPEFSHPIPRRAGVESFYGSFDYKEHPDTPGAIIIEREWVRQNIVGLTLHTGRKVWVHRLVAHELGELFEKACKITGYTPKSVASWVPRHMRWDSKRNLSRHSWGIAFDIDPSLNGVGMKDTPLHRHPEWAQVFRDAGWTCGMDWKNYPDPMHFERVAR